MKMIKRLIRVMLLFMVVGASVPATAQKAPDPKEIAIKNMVDSQRYVFHAQYANPQGGRQKVLTTEYTFLIAKDTIIASLPYFGRAYSAPYGSTDGGITFTSTDFDYQIATRKKGGWDITIKPKDIQGGQEMNMTIFTNGTASLQATSNIRQPISFNGFIEAIKPKK